MKKIVLTYIVMALSSLTANSQQMNILQPYSIELEDSARMGNVDAMYKMGRYYYQEFKKSNERDSKLRDSARNYLTLASEKGHVAAIYGSAFMNFAQADESYNVLHVYGRDKKLIEKLILQPLNKAADLGNADAEYALSVLYSGGYSPIFFSRHKGIRKDSKKAKMYFDRAVEHGSMQAYYDLARKEMGKKNYKFAFDNYNMAAILGDARALYKMGWLYYEGMGIDKNTLKAEKCWRKTIDIGYATSFEEDDYLSAYECLAKYYFAKNDSLHGIEYLARYCQERNDEVYWDELKSIAEKGNPMAEYWMGECYSRQDVTYMAEEWYLRAAKHNFAPAKGKLGYSYYYKHGTDKKWEDAGVKWIMAGAQQGDAWSERQLAILYEDGLGREQLTMKKVDEWTLADINAHLAALEESMKNAHEWNVKAAENGNADAQFSVGYDYYDGEVVKKNIEEAKKWFEKAAKQGHVAGQKYLGIVYNDIEKSPADAYEWFLKAANQKDPYSIFRIGLFSWNYRDKQKGEGDENLKKAVRLFQYADSLGNRNAAYYLGWHYYIGIKDDIIKGMEYLKKASSRGMSFATYKIGDIYDKGFYIRQDYDEAFKWLKQAAEHKVDPSGDAMRRLADYYMFGIGNIPKDEDKGMYWMKEAAKHENGNAKEIIEQMNK